MKRLLPLVFLVGCAELPPVLACDPAGELVEPDYVRVGNDDQIVASLRYDGCDEFDFKLCGVGANWLREDGATLGVWHDNTLGGCDDEILEDEPMNLYPLRTLYIDEYDRESADLLLIIGGVEVDYSFTAE